MAEHAEGAGTIREAARLGRRSASPGAVNERLEASVGSHALLRRLLDFGVLAKALAIAIVLTLLVAVALSPKLGAVVLVLSFFAGWYLLAKRAHEQRRPTQEAAEDG
jgi:hypothetical protein